MVRLDLVRDKISRLRETAALLRACLPEQAAARELAGLVDPFCDAMLAFAEAHPS
jgi:hypothetical protein